MRYLSVLLHSVEEHQHKSARKLKPKHYYSQLCHQTVRDKCVKGSPSTIPSEMASSCITSTGSFEGMELQDE